MNTLFALMFFFSFICIPIFLIWALVKRFQKKSAGKTLKKALVAAIVFISSFIGFAVTMEPVVKPESIELIISDYQPEYDINTEIPVEISVAPEDADTRSLKYITDSETLTFSESMVNTGSEEGTYQISIESGNVKSNTITVSVVDMTAREAAQKAEEKAAKEAEEKRLAEEKAAKEAEEKRLAEEEAAKEAEEKARQKASAAPRSSSQGNSSGGNGDNFNTYDNVEQQKTSDTFVLNTGRHKIHYPSCRDVPKIAPQNYSTSSLSLDELKAQGYTTCGHCF